MTACDARGERGQVFATSKKRFREAFSIDPRSLAAMRVLLAAYLLVDLATRALDLDAFSVDAGVFPRADFGASPSLHALSGGAALEASLFAVAALAAVAVLVGWHTRVAVVACWVLTVSLHNRSPEILISGDKMIRLLLFWSMFLPLGARAGLDARRRDRRHEAAPIVSLAGAALLVQVVVIYPLTVLRKMQSPPWRDLSMVARVLSVDGVTSPLGRLLRHASGVMPLLAALTLFIEAVVPFLALTSFRRGKVRTFAALGMVFFHLVVLGTTLFLGLFPFIMTVAWSVFLPPWFWDEALPRARRASPALDRVVDRLAALVGRVEGGGAASAASAPRAAGVAATVAVISAAALILVDGALSIGGGTPATRPAIELLRLDQDWELYTGVMTNRYHVYAARLRDGAWIDLHRGGAPLDWNQPRNRPEDNRWWKYLLHVVDEPWKFAPALTSYLVRGWDREHPDRPVESVDIVMLERPYELEPGAPSRRVSIWHEEVAAAGGARGRPVAREDWSAGDRVGVVVVVPPGPIASGCGADLAAGAEACAFEPGSATPRGDLDAARVLHPLTRVAGAPILATADGLGAASDAGRRLACTFVVSGKVTRPRVRWSDDGGWFGTRTDWPSGRLVDCKPAP